MKNQFAYPAKITKDGELYVITFCINANRTNHKKARTWLFTNFVQEGCSLCWSSLFRDLFLNPYGQSRILYFDVNLG